MAVQAIALGATIALARLISPAQFGLFAIGVSVQQAVTAIVYLGLPASLIRQEQWPGASQQHAVAGFALAVGGGLSLLTFMVAFVVLPLFAVDSQLLKITAVSCLALPVLATRVIPITLLTRNLEFGRLAIVDVTSQALLYGGALAVALLHGGVYAMVGAIPVAAIASSLLAGRLQSWDRGFAVDIALISSLARFGAQVGAIRFLLAFFDASVIAVASAVGGGQLGGFYAMSRRFLALPLAIMGTIQQVGFPALARADGQSSRTQLTVQAIGVSSVCIGFPVALLVGAGGPLVEALLGTHWLPTVEIVSISSAGLLIFASFGGVRLSRSVADGDARSPLVAVVAQVLVAAGLGVLLVPSLKATGVGISVAVAYLTSSLIMLVRIHDKQPSTGMTTVLRSAGVAWVAIGAGMLIRVGEGTVELAVSLTVTAAVWLSLAMLVTPSELGLLKRLLHRHVVGGPPASAGDRPR